MKELTKIEPQPELNDKGAKFSLEWLAKSPNYGLNPENIDPLIRLLIQKVNDLTEEVNRIKNDSK